MKSGLVGRVLFSRLFILAALMLSVLFLSATARPAEAQSTTGVFHIVQRGEHLSLIARNYGSSVQAILATNPQITNPNLIFAGQTIFVPFGTTPPAPPPTPVPPPPPPSPTCRWWHLVAPGDTLFKIGRLYGVDPFNIARANNIFNLNLIYAGTTLCIP